MKWKSIVAGALASVLGTLFIAGSASADVRIVNDPGGEVSSYLRTFYEMRATIVLSSTGRAYRHARC